MNSRSGPVFVFGHSYGGVAALEATFLTGRIGKLMLYEPPLHEPVANNLAVATKVEELIRKGELEQAFITCLGLPCNGALGRDTSSMLTGRGGSWCFVIDNAWAAD